MYRTSRYRKRTYYPRKYGFSPRRNFKFPSSVRSKYKGISRFKRKYYKKRFSKRK